ncbi:MAG TPA: KH domain-containing protein [Thermomicrobiales bacterium]|nr:KH domain-containing protein [Thermomicrobiales bacterium]
MADGAVVHQRSDDAAVAALTDLVIWLTGELVDDADQAIISTDRRGNHVAVRLELPEQQLGQVIGRGGRIARALRTALMVAGSRHDLRVSLDIEATDEDSDA